MHADIHGYASLINHKQAHHLSFRRKISMKQQTLLAHLALQKKFSDKYENIAVEEIHEAYSKTRVARWRWRGGVRDSVLAPDARIKSFKVGSALFSNLRH